MDFIKEIKSFQTIVEEGTFTKAANKLNYAQSTITNHIKKLEQELGVELFLEGKSNVLTIEGELLKQKAPTLIAQWLGIKEQLLNASEKIDTKLRIGILQPYDILILPKLLSTFTQQYPKLKFEIVVGSTVELVNAVNEDNIDFALCSLHHEMQLRDDLGFEPLFLEEIHFITSVTKSFIFKDFNDLNGKHLYRLGDGYPFCKKLEAYLDSQVSSIQWETVNNITTVPYLVEETGYASLIPHSIINNTPRQVQILSVPLPKNQVSIGLLFQKNFPAFQSITKDFLTALKLRFL